MNEIQAKIYYIYHSGFAIKTENHFLIFDYYMDTMENNKTNASDVAKQRESILSPENIKDMKNIIVFSTHSHGDHFNPSIFNWENYNSEIQYVLSSDIKASKEKSNYSFIEEGEEKLYKDFYVKAYGSTDIGISFLVKVDGLTIFHAGDLNWWHWKEDNLEEQLIAEKAFKSHIEKLKVEKVVDIAFFPVDPRLEEFYNIGAEHFAKEIKPKLLVPMHFGEDTCITKEFKEKMKKINIKAVEIKYPGQEIIY